MRINRSTVQILAETGDTDAQCALRYNNSDSFTVTLVWQSHRAFLLIRPVG